MSSQWYRPGIAAAGARSRIFSFPVLGPGWLGHFLFNAYYPTEEEYVYAMAAMYKGEYEAVVEAGFILQIDDPGLADKFGMFHPPITVEAFRKHADLRIEARTGPSVTLLKTGPLPHVLG